MGFITLFNTADAAYESIEVFLLILKAFSVIFGAIECFFGYKLFRITTAITGFLFGGIIGAIIGLVISGGEIAGMWIGALVFGALGAWLSFKLYKLAVFIACSLMGGVIGLGIGLIGGDLEIAGVMIPVVGILFGVLGVILTKPVIIISSAIGGGIAIGSALDGLLGGDGLGSFIGILIGIAGILLQFWMERKAQPKTVQNAEAVPSSVQPAYVKANSRTGASIASSARALLLNVKDQLLPTPVTTRTTHRCDGYKVLAQSNSPLWLEGLPLVVTETYIANQDHAPDTVLFFGFQNLSDQVIAAVSFQIRCFNLFQEELQPIEKLVVQDIALQPGEIWFAPTPYPLPDVDTRSLEIAVQSIATTQGVVWNDKAGERLLPMPGQEALDLPKELTYELSRLNPDYPIKFNLQNVCMYRPADFGSYWICTCGQLNLRKTCLACGLDKAAAFGLTNPSFLLQKKEFRLAAQKKLEEERRQKIVEQTQDLKENAGRLTRKSLETVQKGYEKSVKYSKQGGQKIADQWKRLTERAQDFCKENILPNRKKLLVILGSLASAVVVVMVLVLGVHKYLEYQNEQEVRKLAEQAAEEQVAKLWAEVEAVRLEAERQREQEEQAQSLRLEYEQIIANTPLYDGFTPGLIYADYLDMNQDGVEELLLLSASSGEIDVDSVITAQVYAGTAGQSSLCGEVTLDIYCGKADSRISIYQKDNRFFLSTYYRDDASSIPTYIHYYGFDGSSLILEDQLSSIYDWVNGEERKATIYEPENFEEIAAQYVLVNDLFTFDLSSGASYIRGILPEPEVSPDIQRRIALLDVLGSADDLVYANLIDLDQDGDEDLLTMYRSNTDYGLFYFFRSYLWDGQQLQEVDLSQVGNEEIDSYLRMGFGSYGLYQRTDSGQLYVCYDGEIVGGWGGTLFVNLLDPTDYEFCGYPFIGSDYSPEFYTPEEAAELEAQYAQEENAYNAFMGRYQLVDQIYETRGQETDASIQSAIRQLETI